MTWKKLRTGVYRNDDGEVVRGSGSSWYSRRADGRYLTISGLPDDATVAETADAKRRFRSVTEAQAALAGVMPDPGMPKRAAAHRADVEFSKRQGVLLASWSGMVRKQKERVLAELEQFGVARATSDQRARFEACDKIVFVGMAVQVSRGMRYVSKGPLTAEGKRRQREVIVIAKLGHGEEGGTI